ncbi:MAG: oligopeptide ABC transporter ATP-binding protein, partial [Candidatus Heimdallarchaeota archaeon]|nr:oligopeptide ABC transporter ATP-binding protein [Candidatus Heimdallarchaeota archaeon]
MSDKEVIVSVRDLTKLYPVKRNFFQSLASNVSQFVHAVDGLSFDVHLGET